ncbi:hypothetical protein MmTuc01_0063 [Methanosarcina mazei Tuc01]|uniref:Uncharacterized protein n=1 Tax=Methanosarcina mazei Tuc01 TaxID=1236903 RepID=M1PTQ4_METMZ|nr:hypothetical protein MmTuc01_0063 [Methanosarcina mazei Tuc01]
MKLSRKPPEKLLKTTASLSIIIRRRSKGSITFTNKGFDFV